MVLIKWVGSKNASKAFIADTIGYVDGNYMEPFLGGGSAGWELLRRDAIKGTAFLSDIDDDIMMLWRVVQNKHEELKQRIIRLVNHGIFNQQNYYRIRAIFNGDEEDNAIISQQDSKFYEIDRAAVIYYLNRQGFNGLWRRNASGKYNVPVGDNNGVQLAHAITEIDRHHDLLSRDCVLSTEEFEPVTRRTKKNDVMYLDPPYYSKSGKNFTQFNGRVFAKEDMDTMFACAQFCSRRGVRVFISAPGYFEPSEVQMQRVKEIHRLSVTRAVNSNGAGRGAVEEKLLELMVD